MTPLGFAVAVLAGVVAGAVMGLTLLRRRPERKAARRCASARHHGWDDRCPADADPRCSGGNCTGHCNSHCGDACRKAWERSRDFIERHPEVH